MDWLGREWHRALFSLMPVGLLLALAACSNATGGSDPVGVAALQAEATSVVDPGESDAVPSGAIGLRLAVNVGMTDDGFQPPSIFIPVGRPVKLVVRNRSTTEHHYRVVGLVPEGLEWLAGPEDVRVEGVTEEDHQIHHTTGYMPFRSASPEGIKPLGDEVHAYVTGFGGLDVVLFTATNTGTFLVQCPLHPEMVGEAVVF